MPVELRLGSGYDASLAPLWSGIVNVRTRVEGTIEDVLPSADAQTIENIRTFLANAEVTISQAPTQGRTYTYFYVHFDRSLQPQAFTPASTVGVGLRMELFQGNRLLGHKRFNPAESSRTRFSAGEQIDIAGELQASDNSDSTAFTLRITSDDDMALRDFTAKVRWVGSVTIPLTSANTKLSH